MKVVLVPAIAAIASATPAQTTVASSCFVEQAKLTASDAEAGDQFGNSVSLSGDRALVAAWLEDNGVSDGSAYVFLRNGTIWTEEAKLTPGKAGHNTAFGESVSLSGDRAIVGAPGLFILHEGRAQVFVRSGTSWTREAILTPSDGPTSLFGRSVGLEGDRAIVGSYGNESAYVFVRGGRAWTEEAKLTASDADAGDYFGSSVSLAGNRALVGAREDDANGDEAGSAYVFVRSGTTWTEEAKLMASDPVALDHFGSSVSLSGDRALVGAPGTTPQGGKGQAYVFVRNGTIWTEEAKLTASDGEPLDYFGTSVSLSGDTALVGAFGDDVSGSQSGSAYVFVRSGTSWAEAQKLTASDGAAQDTFGDSVSLSGAAVLVGSKGDDDNGSISGSAYVFAPPEPSVYCTAGISASGCQASIGHAGVASASASSGFSLVASGVEGSKDGLFFFGTHGQQANPWGNGTSFQCVVPPVVRTGLLSGSGTVGGCDGVFAQDLNALWCPTCPKPQKNPGVCATVQAQLWYRDPGSTSNQPTSFSDALEFVVHP
jgi:hypothetical protein